ncbi:hypothetical protein [Pseudomonas aeruginosa]|uniref:hypothetical protein n=1 Tax=Pseudomonas aeruginosa TaxID=287 RepID=UPI002447D4C2|nr:hypothetical protein [Pseudomonas aeruginosa]MDH0070061.1 hypothetical protein [Pseudomonas aeruginosa]
MSNELTDVRCSCGDEYPADSYDAGFIAGSGMCQNCDAALTPKDICTCPSGDGSLRHPCPAHIGPFDKLVGSPVHNESEPDLPPLDEHLAQVFETGMALSESVEQAGGDERVIGWRERILAAHPNSDPGFWPDALLVEHMAAEIADLRAALAQPSGEVVVTKNESGAIVSVTRQDKEGRVLSVIAESATLTAQAEQAEAERPEVAEVAFVLRNIGAMDAEDIDGDNVDLRFEDAEGRDTGCDVSIVEYAEKAADLFEQHDRIVGALRAKAAQLREALEWRAENQAGQRELLRSVTAERDAALARVAELEAALSSALSQHGIKFMDPPDGGDTPLIEQVCRMSQALAELEKQESVAWVEVIDRDYGPYKFYGKRLLPKGKHQLYAAPVAQAQHSVPVAREQLERLVRILDAHNYAKDAEALMALLAAAPAQAQHSVPEGLALIPVRETEAMHDAVMALLYKGVARTDTQKLLDAYIAAAPGKEVGHE